MKDDQFEDVIKKAVSNSPSKRIDTLINNAGVSQGKQFGNTSKNALDVVFDTNVKGIYLFSQEFAKYLIQKGIKGNIHNVCSSSSNRPAASPYSISKWAEAGLTKGMAKSLIKNDIVVNAVAPGPTASGMMMKASDGDLSRKTSPTGRFVTAEEIANLSVFLISQASRMVVGETGRQEDIEVNVCKTKHLTNTRSSGADEALKLVPPRQLSLEQSLDFLDTDELLEITPENLRIRKKILDSRMRMRANRQANN